MRDTEKPTVLAVGTVDDLEVCCFGVNGYVAAAHDDELLGVARAGWNLSGAIEDVAACNPASVALFLRGSVGKRWRLTLKEGPVLAWMAEHRPKLLAEVLRAIRMGGAS